LNTRNFVKTKNGVFIISYNRKLKVKKLFIVRVSRADMSQTTTRVQQTFSYKKAKAHHKQQSLESAVEWAKALKCLKAEKKAIKFQLAYCEKVLSTVQEQMAEATPSQIKELFEILGSKEKFVGKSELIDGKPYQPSIQFDKFDTEDEPMENRGAWKIIYIKKQIIIGRDDLQELRRNQALLVAKQKFYRYSYNRDTENMMLEHHKISESEGEKLNEVMEADADGEGGVVIFHQNSEHEEDLDELALGMKQQEYAKENQEKVNGNYIREYGDRIKHAFEIREGIIKTAQMLNDATEDVKKHGLYRVEEIQTTTAEGSIPNLF